MSSRFAEPCRRGIGGSAIPPSTSTSTPSGTLTNSTDRQPSTSVSAPPRNTPTAPPLAAVVLHTARARVRARRSVYTERQQAQGSRRQQRRSDPLHRSRRQQHAAVRRYPAGQTRGREDQSADQVDPLAAEMVAEAPAEQDQAAQRQQVGIDHPLQIGRAEMQPTPHRRQRDVHDRARPARP